jgi:hypothetical protein
LARRREGVACLGDALRLLVDWMRFFSRSLSGVAAGRRLLCVLRPLSVRMHALGPSAAAQRVLKVRDITISWCSSLWRGLPDTEACASRSWGVCCVAAFRRAQSHHNAEQRDGVQISGKTLGPLKIKYFYNITHIGWCAQILGGERNRLSQFVFFVLRNGMLPRTKTSSMRNNETECKYLKKCLTP